MSKLGCRGLNIDHRWAKSEFSDKIFCTKCGEPQTSKDYGYLQHGQPPGPFRTEKVLVKNDYGTHWLAFYEGRWRVVHFQLNRTFLNFKGAKITIQIEGV